MIGYGDVIAVTPGPGEPGSPATGVVGSSSEYLSGHFEKVGTATRFGELDVDGFYVNLAYILTGEDAVRDLPIKPLGNFDPSQGGWGAWQVAGRYQSLSTNRDLINLGLVRGTDKAQSVTLALNWFPNRHIRFQFNFDHAWLEDEIIVQGVTLDDENTFIARLQCSPPWCACSEGAPCR